MSEEAQGPEAVNAREVYHALLLAHRVELHDSNNGPEWLEEASCSPHGQRARTARQLRRIPRHVSGALARDDHERGWAGGIPASGHRRDVHAGEWLVALEPGLIH
jgi:hypothetical protein